MRNTDVPWINGATHFEGISFVFYNLDGVGYHYGAPFNGTPASYADLSELMTSMRASFVVDNDPNMSAQNTNYWPAYELDNPLDHIFSANTTSDTEADTWREAGIQYIIDIASAYPR